MKVAAGNFGTEMLLLGIILLLGSPLVFSSYGTLYEQFNSSSFELMRHITDSSGKGVAYNWLAELVDDFGPRQVGSENLEKAIDFLYRRLQVDGFDNVRTQKVHNLPHWRRGDDSVMLIEPRLQKLNILAIDGTVSGDITAEAIVVSSFDEIPNHNISGKIVVLVEKWNGYGKTVQYRKSAHNKLLIGAAGVLVKSVTPFSIGSVHTGNGARGSSIVAASLTVEEAEMLQRLYNRGKRIVIRMNIKSRDVGKVSSRNVIFEITDNPNEILGSVYPKEIVLLSAHVDSWDVGQGAIDDGGGMAVIWHTLKTLKYLSERDQRFALKRTLRAIFWTAEEQGFYGSQAYFNENRKDGLEKYFLVSESDQGAFRPTNWDSVLRFQGSTSQMEKIQEVVKIINDFGIPLSMEQSTDQGDVSPWAKEGVPSVNYVPDKGFNYYFYFHHTQADYMTIFKNNDLEYTTAIFSTLAHVICDIDGWN